MRLYLFYVPALLLAACHSKKDVPAIPPQQTTVIAPADTAGNFFPVTEYLKGEIVGIENGGITPIDKITSGRHVDSSWLNTKEKMEAAFAAFTSPLIDTANLKALFTENKFRDQTLNAFTFSYDPVGPAADSFTFRHWDIYVDPDNNKVRRIYLVKQLADGRTLQMTWQSGKWCKMVTLKTTGDKTEIEKEEKISWNYDKE